MNLLRGLLSNIFSKYSNFYFFSWWLLALIVYYQIHIITGVGENHGDVFLYFRLASDLIGGDIPYIDYFFEYPPASIFVFALPFIFASDQTHYVVFFQIISWFVFLITICLLYRLYLRYTDRKEDLSVLWIIGVINSLLIVYVINRYDTFPLILSVLGLYFYTLNHRYRTWNWTSTLAWIFCLIGGLVKFYPILILPFFILFEFKNKKWKDLLVNLVVSFLVALPFGIWVLQGIEGLRFFLEYHGDRGLEIESTAATIVLMLKHFGVVQDELVYEFASFGLDGSLSDFLASISLPTFVVVYGIIIALLFFRKNGGISERENNDVQRNIYYLSCGSIILFATFNKVFSAQYIVWFVPLITIWVNMEQDSIFNFRKRLYIVLYIIISTFIVFPILWTQYINNVSIILTLILLIRNILLTLVGFLFIRKGLAMNNTSKKSSPIQA